MKTECLSLLKLEFTIPESLSGNESESNDGLVFAQPPSRLRLGPGRVGRVRGGTVGPVVLTDLRPEDIYTPERRTGPLTGRTDLPALRAGPRQRSSDKAVSTTDAGPGPLGTTTR